MKANLLVAAVLGIAMLVGCNKEEKEPAKPTTPATPKVVPPATMPAATMPSH